MPQADDDRVGDRGRGRGTRTRVEERQLPEDLARAEDRQKRLTPVRGRLAQLHLAVEDDVHPITGFAL